MRTIKIWLKSGKELEYTSNKNVGLDPMARVILISIKNQQTLEDETITICLDAIEMWRVINHGETDPRDN